MALGSTGASQKLLATAMSALASCHASAANGCSRGSSPITTTPSGGVDSRKLKQRVDDLDVEVAQPAVELDIAALDQPHRR
jgi:hypothetical protein